MITFDRQAGPFQNFSRPRVMVIGRSVSFSPPTYPKLTNMLVLSGQFADVGLHCRCLRMFPGRVTLFTDVPSLFADELTKPAYLAIGPHNRDSVNRA